MIWGNLALMMVEWAAGGVLGMQGLNSRGVERVRKRKGARFEKKE